MSAGIRKSSDPLIPSSLAPHVVIIGGGFGGLAAARGLRGAPVWVTLLDARNHHLFQPLLYQVAMAGLSPADIAEPVRSILHRQGNAQVLLGEAARVDFNRRRVILRDGAALRYDFLIIAAGARTNYFGHEAEWSQYSLPLKTVEDALEVRSRVLMAFEAAEREPDPEARRRLLTFVVIGGGPTGVEVAGALSELARFVLSDDFRHIDPAQARIVLIEGLDRLLPGGFDTRLSKKALAQLTGMGIEVRLSVMVERIDERGVQLPGERIESTTVLWTAGVRAAGLAASLGVEVDTMGRIIVEPDCSIPGHPNVFAIGDIARFVPAGGDQPLPGLAAVAMQQGRYVAKATLRRIAQKSMRPFVYRDRGIMATIGRSRAVAQIRGVRLSGFIAWLMWLAVHIWYLIGFRNRVMVLINWFWNYVTYKRGARLITGTRTMEMPAFEVSAPASVPSSERQTADPRV